MPEFTSEELRAIANSIEKWDKICLLLRGAGLKPLNFDIHVQNDMTEEILGTIQCLDGGEWGFVPKSKGSSF